MLDVIDDMEEKITDGYLVNDMKVTLRIKDIWRIAPLDFQDEFVVDFNNLYQWGFKEFHDSIKTHLNTNKDLRISFQDDEEDVIPIESDDEYYEFLKFLRYVSNSAQIFVILDDRLGKNSTNEKVRSPKKSVKFSAGTMSEASSDAELKELLDLKFEEFQSKVNDVQKKLIPRRGSTNEYQSERLEDNEPVPKAFRSRAEKHKQQLERPESEDEAPEWLKRCLDKFKDDLLQEVTNIVKGAKPKNSNTSKTTKAKKEKPDESSKEKTVKSLKKKSDKSPEEKPDAWRMVGNLSPKKEEQPQMNEAGDTPRAFHHQSSTQEMLKRLEKIQKREKRLDQRMEKVENKKKKILEKVTANRNRMQNPRTGAGIYLMDATLLGDEGPLYVKQGLPFTKVWQVMNSGFLPWTDKTELKLTFGLPGMEPESSVKACPLLKPNQVGSLSVTFKELADVGTYKSFWHFFHMGETFGPWVCCHVVVEPENLCDKIDRGIEELEFKADEASVVSESESDNESCESIAVISDSAEGENVDDSGFVVVPMPPCFFPNHPQDSTVKVVVKTKKKCDSIEKNSKDQAPALSQDVKDDGVNLSDMSDQYMKKFFKPEKSVHTSVVPEKTDDEGLGAMGGLQSQPLDMTSEVRDLFDSDMKKRLKFLRGSTDVEDNQTSSRITNQSADPNNVICSKLRQFSIDDNKPSLEAPEGFNANATDLLPESSFWEQELDKLKRFNNEYTTGVRPNDFGMGTGHGLGLAQQPFFPLMPNFAPPPPPPPPPPPVHFPPHCFSGSHIPPPPPPHHPFPAPPPPHTHHPIPPPPHPLPPHIPLGTAHHPSPPTVPLHSLYFPPQPVQMPLPIPVEFPARPVYYHKLRPVLSEDHSDPQEEHETTFPNVNAEVPGYGGYYNIEGANYSDNLQSAAAAAYFCNPVDLSNRHAKFENTTNESTGAFNHEASACDSTGGANKPDCIPVDGSEWENLMKNASSKADAYADKTQKKIAKSLRKRSKSKSSYPDLSNAISAEDPVPPPAGIECSSNGNPARDVPTIDPALGQIEYQPYVDILPESLVNGVISAVNTASSAYTSAINSFKVKKNRENKITDDPRFSESIIPLYEMGFTNYEKNCRLLKQYDFDVQKVVAHYCANP